MKTRRGKLNLQKKGIWKIRMRRKK